MHVEMDPEDMVCNEYLKYTKRFLMIRRRYTTLVVYIPGFVYIFSLAEAGWSGMMRTKNPVPYCQCII